MTFLRKLLRLLVPIAAVGLIAAAALTRDQWLPFLLPEPVAASDDKADEAGSTVPEARQIEVEQQIRRQQTAAKALRLDLGNRGFTPAQIDAAAAGQFVRELTVVAPPVADATFEVEELKVNLGEQVQAGQAL